MTTDRSGNAPAPSFSGAGAFLAACRAAGMDTCFANPGTTELAFVRAFAQVPGWRVVSGLFEGVCTGAADGYGRMAGKPALTLTHLGPGFANGIANLHNARRARSPIVNVIGDHATAHLAFDAPLTSDIDSLARPVSAVVHHLEHASRAAGVAATACQQALANGGQVVTVVFSADAQAAAVPAPLAARAANGAKLQRQPAPPQALAEAGRRLADGGALLLLGGNALTERGLKAAQRIADQTGAALYCETFPARIERGNGLPAPERFPYFPEPAFALVAGSTSVIVVGAPEPVTYFAYPGYPSRIVPGEKLAPVCGPTDDAASSLQQLADLLGCPPYSARGPVAAGPEVPGPWDATTAARCIAARLPARAIVSVEGGSCGYPFFTASALSERHTVLTNTGGAIGQGLPVAVGAALACPDRRVVCVQSDGSAQYTIQALWTMAREQLPITVLIAANRRYAVLQNELHRDGVHEITGAAASLTSLDNPPLDWTALASGYGVGAVAVRDAEALQRALDHALAVQGPYLIEMLL